jgi:hypothetical protein
MRTIRWADEVWTPTGIVDSIRFEDYYTSDFIMCPFVTPERYWEAELEYFGEQHEIGKCFRDGKAETDPKKCKGCVFKHHGYNVGMMCTCYEVKITLSDFKSEHGHNFHGNENYYVVPKELAPKIESLVPKDIGILTYHKTSRSEGLRVYKKSGWREVPDDVMVRLLYDAMRKWCDKIHVEKEEEGCEEDGH